MSHDDEKAKRKLWRPRFSIRTLVILVTLVCAYFGAWEITERAYGPYGDTFMAFSLADDKALHDRSESAPVYMLGEQGIDFAFVTGENIPAPFIVSRYELLTNHKGRLTAAQKRRRTFYVWFFGPKFKLPFETTWERRLLRED